MNLGGRRRDEPRRRPHSSAADADKRGRCGGLIQGTAGPRRRSEP